MKTRLRAATVATGVCKKNGIGHKIDIKPKMMQERGVLASGFQRIEDVWLLVEMKVHMVSELENVCLEIVRGI